MPLIAVTFDLWNTIYYEDMAEPLRTVQLSAAARALTESGITASEHVLEQAYDESWASFLKCWRANTPYAIGDAASQWAAALGSASLHGPLTQALLDGCRGARFVEVEGVRQFLGRLKSAGIKTAIISDIGFTPSSLLLERLEKDGLLDYFDAATFSDEVGCFKPDPRMFRDALRKLDCAPTHDVAHVGDGRRTDVAGALAMGMLAVRFAGVYDDQNDNEGPSGDLVVRSYPELASAVGLA